MINKDIKLLILATIIGFVAHAYIVGFYNLKSEQENTNRLKVDHEHEKHILNRVRDMRLDCHEGAEKHAISEYNRVNKTTGDLYMINDYERIFEDCLRRNNVE